MKPRVIITCEHGGNEIPVGFHRHTTGLSETLAGHEGWDPGSRRLATEMAAAVKAPLHTCTVSRLLIDVNRSPDSPGLFSPHVDLPASARALLVERVWRPYRQSVFDSVHTALEQGCPVILVSVHSFTPVWKNAQRKVDVGLLFDPSRPAEAEFCERWRRDLSHRLPHLRVRDNQPYTFEDDGIDRTLRLRHRHDPVAPICLEVNQGIVLQEDPRAWKELRTQLAASLASLAAHRGWPMGPQAVGPASHVTSNRPGPPPANRS